MSMFLALGRKWRPDPFAPRSYAGLYAAGDVSSTSSTGTADRYRLAFTVPDLPDLAAIIELARAGRLSIRDLPRLLVGDQTFVRREIVGPVWEWIGAFLIRVGTFTRKDKRPTVVNHVATVVRELRATEAAMISDVRLTDQDIELLRRIDETRFLKRTVDQGITLRDADGIEISVRPADQGPIVDYVLAEALGSGGFQYRRLLGAYGDARKYSIAIARNRLVTDRHREKIVAACERLLGKSYGYLKIGAHALDYGLTKLWQLTGARSDVYAFRWLCRMERYPMCSWASLYEYAEAGVPFSTPIETGSPDDLADECREKSSVWDWPYISPAIADEILAERRAQ